MENLKPVLVAGATGFLGSEICKQLSASGKKVKALVRSTSDPERIKFLQDHGVETVTGDLKDPVSLERALQGVGAVVSTASSTLSRTDGDSIQSVDREGQLNLVDAAGKAFVDQFVFISFGESPYNFPLQDAKREVEQKLIDSNMNYTILRAGYFMEVWLGPHLGFDPANHKATIYGHGSSKVSWISIRDVAAFAVASLHHPAAINSILDIGVPEALSQLEAVKIFEDRMGASFQLQYIPEEALHTQMEVSTDPVQKTFACLMQKLVDGDVIEMNSLLKQFPFSLRSVREYSELVTLPVSQRSDATANL